MLGAGREGLLVCLSLAQGSSALCNLICLSLKYGLELADFFCREPSDKYLPLRRPCGPCHSYFQKQVADHWLTGGDLPTPDLLWFFLLNIACLS